MGNQTSRRLDDIARKNGIAKWTDAADLNRQVAEKKKKEGPKPPAQIEAKANVVPTDKAGTANQINVNIPEYPVEVSVVPTSPLGPVVDHIKSMVVGAAIWALLGAKVTTFLQAGM